MAKTLYGMTVSEDVYSLNAETKLGKATKRNVVKAWSSERHFQAAVFEAAGWEALRRPEFGMLFAVPNENSHKVPGVKAGIPDLFLSVPRGGKSGMFCELKVGSGKLSLAQQSVISDLRTNGYAVFVIWDSVEQVISCINDYLKGDQTCT